MSDQMRRVTGDMDLNRLIDAMVACGKTAQVEMVEEIFTFLKRFIAYPNEHAAISHTLWVLHTHLMAH
jgi:hypothetical protein